MKFLIELEILDNNIYTNENSETTITVPELIDNLRIGFEDWTDDDDISFMGTALLRWNDTMPVIQGYKIYSNRGETPLSVTRK